MIRRTLIIVCLLFAPTVAIAQTNPLGAGYSLTHGQLYVQISPSLNSLTLPFSMSFNVTAPTVSGSINNFITSNQAGSTSGGFNVQYNTAQDTYRLKATIQPSAISGGFPACSHSGQLCWRAPFIVDGNRHNVCVRWTPTMGYFYLDGILRDQTLDVPVGIYSNSPELFWSIGNGAPTGWTFYDTRVYSGDIGGGGCVALSNFNQQGVYPTTGALSTGMVLHLPLDNCTNVSTLWTCNDTSGNSNNASNATLAPTIAITAPSPGTVSGTINLQVTCTVSSGTCAQVCYYADNILISGTCPTTSPTYTYAWDTTKILDGSHTLTAVGYTVSGLSATSSGVVVTTSNGSAAITYKFDAVSGLDTNNCTSAPCQTISKASSLTYKGGDTLEFSGNETFNAAASLLICGPGSGSNCTQNFYPGAATFTITTYNASACNPLTGNSTAAPANCAIIQRTGGGTTSGVLLWNASNAVVENIAQVGTTTTEGNSFIQAFDIEATDQPIGASANVTIQNNYVRNWNYGVASNVVAALQGTSTQKNQATNGQITNLQVLDNYITATFGATNSPDGGIVFFGGTQGLVQGNLTENAGNHGNDSQGNGYQVQNWPNPGGGATPTIFQFNVTHDNGGNHNVGNGGPYSLYSIGGDNTIFQYNEEYNQRCWFGGGYPTCLSSYGGIDNGGADDDHSSTFITHQYNYIHDNPMPNSNGMLFFIGTDRKACCGGNDVWTNNLYRFNILENNWLAMQTAGAGGTGNSFFYNNTSSTNISNPGTFNPSGAHVAGTCLLQQGAFYNNLCINTATTGFQYFIFSGGFCPHTVDYNDFYSTTIASAWSGGNFATQTSLAAYITACGGGNAHSKNVNPMLQGTAGAGGTCWPGGTTPPAGPANPPSASNCPAGYQLQTGSPLIGAGVDPASVTGGLPDPTVDYYGNSVPNGVGSGWNIGADGGHH